MLPASAGGDVCRVLQCSRCGWVRSPVRRRQGGSEYPVAAVPRFRFCNTRDCDRMRLCGVSASCRCNGGGHTHPGPHGVQGQQRGENISRPGLRSSEPPGFRGNARNCKFHAADHSVNTRTVSSCGFGNAASFCVFQLWIQERTAASTLTTTHPDSAESLLNIGDVVVRRQGRFPRTGPGGRTTGVRPACGTGLRFLVTCCQAPLERSAVRSVSRESCA